MSTVVAELAEQLERALKTVPGMRVHDDPGANLSPPAAVVGPPTLHWGTAPGEVDSVTFPVFVMVPATGSALRRLWELVPLVAEAIDTMPDAVVRTAAPGFYNSGGSDLPSYTLTVDCAVGD